MAGSCPGVWALCRESFAQVGLKMRLMVNDAFHSINQPPIFGQNVAEIAHGSG
jgi:hypothetical protein